MKKAIVVCSHPFSGWSMVKFSEMVRSVVAIDPQIVCYIPPNHLSKIIKSKRIRSFAIYLEKKVYSSLHLFFLYKFYKPEKILLCDHSDTFLVSLIPKNKLIVVCHDLFAIQAMEGLIKDIPQSFRVKLELKINFYALKRASRLIVDSNTMQNQVLQMIPNAVTSVISPTVIPIKQVSCKPLVQVRYCLLPMNYHWRKNRLLGLKIYSKILESFRQELFLVIVGNSLSDEENTFIGSKSLEPNILHFSNLDEDQMRNLYKFCEFVLFMSKFEGFGLPIIEANFHSRLVVHSDLPVLNEVAGGKNISIGENLEEIDWKKTSQTVLNAKSRKQANLHFESNYSFDIFKSKLLNLLNR